MKLIVLAVALAAALIAGCGSSSSNDSTTTVTITKAEFLKKGNAICKQGNKEISAAGNKIFSSGKPSQAQIEKFATDILIPSVQKQVDDIRALGAPAGDEAQVKAITDAAQQGIDAMKKDPSTVTQSDKTGPFAQANKLANAYGLTVCGSSS